MFRHMAHSYYLDDSWVYNELQCRSRRNAVRKRYYSITAYYICTEYYSSSVAPAMRIKNILTTVTVYDFCYFRYFQLSFYPPPHPPLPLKTSDLHVSQGSTLWRLGGGGLCPQLPPRGDANVRNYAYVMLVRLRSRSSINYMTLICQCRIQAEV